MASAEPPAEPPVDPATGPGGPTPDAMDLAVHPVRARLLSRLRQHGPASATDLARALSSNSGVTSYHLRRLAAAGLVEDTGDGVGRQVLWAAAAEGPRRRRGSGTGADDALVDDVPFDEDDEASADRWLTRDAIHHLDEQFERWLDVEERWPRPWQQAVGISDDLVIGTPEQVAELTREIGEVVERYRRRGAGNPSARRVAVYAVSFPLDLDRPPRETG